MKRGKVYYNHVFAGTLMQLSDGTYVFEYDTDYLYSSSYPAISVHFPKSQARFQSNILFPFFFNMLSEGANRRLQLQANKINDHDYLDLLIHTAFNETIGAVTVGPISPST
jgi:serine/threonine-protein kinase HipA